MKHAYADTAEGQVHYVTEGSGEPLLLIPHTPRSWTYSRHLIPLMARHRTVIAMDTLGFGGSDEAEPGFRIEDYAQNVVHFLEELGLGRTDIWGTVTGACIATEVAAGWPSRVRRLVLMEMPFFITPEERASRIEVYRSETPGTPREDGSHCIDAWRMALSGYDREDETVGLPEEGFQTVTDHTLDLLKAGRRWTEMAIKVHSYDKAPRLARIDAPTLVIGLSEDSPHPYLKRAPEVQALVPNSRLAIVDGGLLSVTYGARADKLAQIVLEFLMPDGG